MEHCLRHLALTAALIGTAGLAAAADEFQPVAADTAINPSFVQRALKPAHVVVLLRGDSVAKVQARLGRKLEAGERASIVAQRRAEQQGMEPSIQALGGQVVGRMQGALNGIRIKIAANRVSLLNRLPGVVEVKRVGTYERVNVNEIPLMGAPQAWQSAGGNFLGQGIKIAVIDTGIDYTHANFGGPGTVAAYNTAKATNTLPADPALFGPAAPKVKGGIDLVGDNYTGANTPVPDPNPLDCVYTSGSSGHGSHVAGTAAGFGVTAAGARYTGPYTAAAYTPGAFSIGPGAAPLADLYSVRVFGCSGNTNVVAEAIDWAVTNGMDVINMSLGSDFGNIGNGDAGSLAEAQAVANAAAAGILVISASGNSGQIPYITSAPAVFEGAISVAATDALAGIPTAKLALSGGAQISVINANGASYPSPTSYPVRVLRNADGSVSLGCDPNEYDPAVTGVSLAGKMVVTARGTCARVYRAGAAQHFGAAAAAMINNAASLPPYEGPIPGGAADPASGNVYEPVTIPFFGIALGDGPTVSGPTGGPAVASATATNTGIAANASFEKIASFSSGGPRIGDSVLRPGITAPGVSVVSTASGTGNGFQILSGTSMATPGVAGVAALTKQAHPTWSQADLRAAIVQTANPSMMQDLLQRNEGAGLVQAQNAVATQAIVRTPDESVSFGFADLLTDFNGTKTVTVHNTGPKAVQFNISVTKTTVPASVIVNANADASFPVTLQVPANAVGGGTGFQDIGGYIQLTPSSSRLNGNVKLSVPYYLVAHSRANLAGSQSGTTINLTNAGGQLSSQPVPFVLGQYQPTPQGIQQNDVRAIGVRASGTNLIFGINTHNRTSTTLGFQEYDICIDTSGNPNSFTPNKILIGINGSLLTSSLTKGQFATAVFPTDANCNINGSGTVLFTVTQPTDNSTLQLPVTRAALGLTSANPRIKYVLTYFGPDGGGAQMPGLGWFNAFTPAVTFGGSPVVPVNGSGSQTFSVTAEQANTPALGVMLFGADNVSGAAQGLLYPLPSQQPQ
ncbi:S8 family serine peptidase [Pelomonas sp. KK5]|uniref:S8 family peptidase n=1 Tax=Pelomonas sp. KK5 TaxID=1855730 RepID=UPI00097CB9DC|nr:S8 family serine peptidase [Pelomonas sp. KK5]